MTNQFTIKLEGEQELVAQLQRFIGFAQRQAKAAVVNAGEDIRTKAKSRVPVDTGNLRNSITRLLKNGGLTVVVGSNVDYAPYVEYGTRAMINAHGEHDPENPVTDWAAKRKRNASGQQMPFLTPSFIEGRKDFMRELNKLMESAVRKRY